MPVTYRMFLPVTVMSLGEACSRPCKHLNLSPLSSNCVHAECVCQHVGHVCTYSKPVHVQGGRAGGVLTLLPVKGDLRPVQSLSGPKPVGFVGRPCLSALFDPVIQQAQSREQGTDHHLLQQVKNIEVTGKDPQLHEHTHTCTHTNTTGGGKGVHVCWFW